jgi:hypothetical protein
MTNTKIRLATVWLAGCSGCHMSFLDLDEWLLELAERAEIVYSPVASDIKTFPSHVDVCLVEGGVANADNLELLHQVRANSRVLRWRTTGLKNRIEGADFEAIYSPARNLQVVVNGAWMWTAKTLIEPTKPKPGTTAFNALSAAGKIDNEIFYNARIENVPEYRLNTNAKYTFTNGSLAGLAVGGAARYSSETVIARNRDWNPLAGGMMAGNFLVFDSTVSYPWEVLGYKINSSLGIYNLLDEKYFEGTFVASPRRTWLLTTTLKF